MASFRLSNTAKEDLIRIHQYLVKKFGVRQADKYFNDFFESFELIVNQPYSFESANYVKEGYRRHVTGSDSIYYIIENETVEIMAIIGRQDLTEIFN
jgi:toxin ParE1/3/4